MTKCGLGESASPDTIEDTCITEERVRRLLKKLNPHKACGRDGISPQVLKELTDTLAPFFTFLYRSWLFTGVVPNDWKTAIVRLVFKKGEWYWAENYLLISLTSVGCRLMEHTIVSSIMNFAEWNIICHAQHGFKSRLCETKLLRMTDECSHDFEKGLQTDLHIMDFSKT